MIIKRIKLQPFGCHSNREFTFQPGLNVILGPNEAGKSTLFKAIQKALLLPTALYKKDFEREIQGCLPIGGGDTVHLELAFEHDGKPYFLKKTWGGGKAAHLQLPDGSVAASDEKVSALLQTLLPAKTGTVRSVLMTYQSGLEKTLADLEEEPDTMQGLADLLRKAVLSSDGISVEGFISKVKGMEAASYSRWDRVNKHPEGGRGIENPWKKDVGTVLKAFYEKEQLRVRYEAASAYEVELDRLNRGISVLLENIAKRNAYYEANQKIVEDVKKRRSLEAEEKFAAVQLKELKLASISWPVLEKEIADLEKIMPDLRTREQVLTREKEAAQTAEKNKTLREQYSRACEKKVSLEAAEKELAGVPKLDRSQLDQIRQVQQRLEKITAGISAGKIAIVFRSKQDVTVKVQRDLELMQETALAAGKTYQVKAGGRLAIEYADLELDITSGEGSFEETRRKHEQAEKDLKSLFAACGVESFEQAQSIHGEYESRLDKVKKEKAVYDSELPGTTFEALEDAIKSLGAGITVRPLAEIIPELVKMQAEITQKDKDIAEGGKTLSEYTTKYVNQDKLLDKLINVRQEEQKLQNDIAGLAPLPAEVTDLGVYQKKFDENFSLLHEEEDKLKKIQLEQAEKVGAAPEDTSEDLKGLFEESEKSFKAALRKGEAITRINAAAQQILGSSGTDIYQELGKDLERIASIITDKKYSGVKMDRSLPEGFVREDGKVIVYDLLSHGTRDMVGFALRLAIAKHFLNGSKGFLAMDDPLVNMDPVRQQKSAEVIKDFASDKQVLIFTCHPGHAEMLGGNHIGL